MRRYPRRSPWTSGTRLSRSIRALLLTRPLSHWHQSCVVRFGGCTSLVSSFLTFLVPTWYSLIIFRNCGKVKRFPYQFPHMRKTHWKEGDLVSFGLDYVAGPPIDAMHAAGVSFVCRYLSEVNAQTVSKILTAGEAKMLSEAGIAIVSNYEWYATR